MFSATPLLPPPTGHGRHVTKSTNEVTTSSNDVTQVVSSSTNENTFGRGDVIVCGSRGEGRAPQSPTQEEMPDDGDCSDTDMEIKSFDLTG